MEAMPGQPEHDPDQLALFEIEPNVISVDAVARQVAIRREQHRYQYPNVIEITEWLSRRPGTPPSGGAA